MKGGGANLGFYVFLIALGLRLGGVVLMTTTRGNEPLFPDENVHWQMAENLLGEGQFATDDGRYAARMPLYPLFLSLTAWLGPTGMIVARLLQALMGATTAWLVYQMGTRALRQRVGLVAGGLVALDPYAIFFAHLLLTEVMFTLIGVLLVGAAWWAMSKDRETSLEGFLGVALLGPLAMLTRPSSAGWIVLLWIVLLALDKNRRRAWRRTGVYACVLALLLLPWGIRNKAVLGSFAWLSANGGATLYDAQGPQAAGDSDQQFLAELKADPAFAALGEAERDRYLRDAAIAQMRQDPWRVVRLGWTKLWRTWSLRPNFSEYRGGLAGFASVAFMLPVLIAAAIGAYRALRNGLPPTPQRIARRLLLLCVLPIVYFTLVHCVYIGSLRYRVPVMPFVELMAGMALLDGRGQAAPRRGVRR